MRNALVTTVAAAFVLASAGAVPYAANAQPSTSTMKHDAEIKDPVKADTALAKDLDKDAQKQAHKAKHKAKVAHHKSVVAADKADQAAKDAIKSQ